MNILIVSNNYLQKSIISSKRWRCFSNYLNSAGHRVWVVCGDYEDYKGDLFNIQELVKDDLHILKVGDMGSFCRYILSIIRFFRGKTQSPEITGDFKNIQRHQYLQKMRRINYIYHYLKIALSNFVYTQFCLSKLRKSKIEEVLKSVRFDVIIASSGPLDSLIMGEAIRKKHPESVYINEFRDMLHARNYLNMAMNDYFIRYEKKHVHSANATLVVSEGQKEMLCEATHAKTEEKDRIHVIYHGYTSLEDIEDTATSIDDSILRISYTGTMDPGNMNPNLLFRAISELSQEGELNLDKIQINIAGIGDKFFYDIAGNYKLASILQTYGFVNKKKALQIQRNSDILLLLSRNNQYEKGILSGKFSEYLISGKPIIALTSGELVNAEITELISTLKVGIACEYINEKEDLPRLKEYILMQYKRKMAGFSLFYEPDPSGIKRFDYDSLTKELVSIFEKHSLCKK